jgi:hypothetical protein
MQSLKSIPMQINFNIAEPGVSTLVDPNESLSKGQLPPTLADSAKMKSVPYFEANGFAMYVLGVPAQLLPWQPPHTGFLENKGATLSEGIKHDFQYLEGARDMRLVCRN